MCPDYAIRASEVVRDFRAGYAAGMRTLLPLLTTLAGCVTVGPDYVAPEIEIPDAWHTELVGPFEARTAPLRTWWQAFQDPTLDQLIEKARANNLDLKIALARIDAARAQLGIAKGGHLPEVSAAGSSAIQRLSEKGLIPPLGDTTIDLHEIGGDAGWEFDFFGGIRRQIESAGAAYEASIEDFRDVVVVLLAEIARNYILVRTLQDQIKFTRSNIAAQRESLALARERNRTGLAPDLDVAQAESNLGTSESLLPALQQLLTAAMHRVAVLLGEHPGTMHDLLTKEGKIPTAPDEVAVGIPANLLRRRPDIRAAERSLASQHARIGATEAELYPRFFLFGSVGLEATKFSDLFDAASRVFTLGAGFRWNIWSGGKIRNAVEAEAAFTTAAEIQYRKIILLAMEEVENSLYGYTKEGERRRALERATAATQRSVELVLVLYRAGLTDFQNVLDSQRSLVNVQNDLARSRGQHALQLVSLYKALGGGWERAADKAEDPPGQQ